METSPQAIPAIDVSALPVPAQKILDPAGPPPLKVMASKGVAPGLKPADMLAVVVLLSRGADANAETARKTLEKLPPPLINGALAAPELHPDVLDTIGPLFAKDAEMAPKILNHPALLPPTVAAIAARADEAVCEMVATNEERLLAHPTIIEKLYLNQSCRMSTADRILELAVRNGLELAIPAFAQAKIAIQGELIAEPTEERTFDDEVFTAAQQTAAEIALAEDEDGHETDDEGKETVSAKMKPLQALWTDLRAPQKIRLLSVGPERKEGAPPTDMKAIRMLGIRDANPQVALAALASPGISDVEIVRITGMRNVAEDVLRDISNNREWTRHYMVKLNLVANPRTPFGNASKWVLHLRESDLKTIAKSKEVSGAIQTAAKQQLQRKGKQG